MITYFQNSFTFRLNDKFATSSYLRNPPHLKCVATLPCEIWMWEKWRQSEICIVIKGNPYSIAERRVPELIPVLGSQPADDVSHKPGGRLPLRSTRPVVTLATLKKAAASFAAWWTEARWVWTVCLRMLPDSVATVIWTQTLLRLSPAR